MKSKLLVIVLMILSESLFGQDTTQNYFVFNKPEYAKTDTVKCLFLEVVKTDSIVTKWTKGYIERANGSVKFKNYRSSIYRSYGSEFVSVSPEYLIISSGIVQSRVFYGDMQPVKNVVIQIILTGEELPLTL